MWCRNRCNNASLLLVAVAAAGFAQQPLSLEDCLRLASSAVSAVSVARLQTEIARYGLTQARAGFLPQASLTNSFTYNSPLRGEFSFIALNGVREYSSLANLGLELDTSGRLRAQLARARADQDLAASSVVLSQRDLKRAVIAAYYRVLLARHVAEAARASLAEAQQFERRTRLLFENAEAAQADVVKAAAESALLQQSLQAAELEARLASHDLASFWTADVDRPLDLVDLLLAAAPPPENPQAGAPYLGRVEFRIFGAQRRGFLADARRARAELYPQLSLVTQYGLDALRLRIADRGYATFLHLNIPVFDWFRARSAARQFRLQAEQVDANRQIAQRAFSRDYQDARARVALIYSQIAMTENQVKLSQDNLRLSRIRYEGGEGLALDVVTAQTQLAQARINYFTAKANYLNARAELEVASGR